MPATKLARGVLFWVVLAFSFGWLIIILLAIKGCVGS